MIIQKSRIILLVLGMLLLHVGAATVLAVPEIYIPTEVQTADGTAHAVTPAINNWAARDWNGTGNLPSLWQTGSAINMMAARGEYEPATFVVETDTLLEGVNVTVTELTGPSGTLHAGALDVMVVQPYHKRVTNPSATLPWVLTHDPGLFTITGGDTNELTRAAIDTPTLQSADIQAGDRQQFWVTAHIPENAKPGTYTATATVTRTNGASLAPVNFTVTVPNFELRAPNYEYSVYYPAFYGWENGDINYPQYAHLSETQYTNEIKNMMAHGLTNPNFYQSIAVDTGGGVLDFSEFEEHIAIREAAGMSYQGKDLYVGENPLRIGTVADPLSPAEIAQNTAYVVDIVAWATGNGYGDVVFMGLDEASGAGLAAESDFFQSVHDGGGKTFAAVAGVNYYDQVGDLLDVPVVGHPGHYQWDSDAVTLTPEDFLDDADAMADLYVNPASLMTTEIQDAIDTVHANGDKMFTYMDPTGGQTLPEAQRRQRGVGMWKTNLDGTMTWAYTHINGNDAVYADGDPLPDLISSIVFRGEEAPFDTLAFEGIREGIDDARYLATLQAAMAAAGPEHAALVASTQAWLDSIDASTADLDAMRLEMAWRIEILAPLVPTSVDITGDGIVGGADMIRLITNWGLTGATFSQGDVDGSGTIGAGDYNMIMTWWGYGVPPEPPSDVPEPATLGLVLLGSLVSLYRRRK